MRIYSLQAPDGNIYDLQAPEGASEQELTATLYSLKPEAAQPFVKESGVIAQGKKGIEQLVSGIQTTGGAIFGDKNEAARDALARQAEFDRKYEQSPSLDRTAEAFKQKGFFSGLGQLASDAPDVLAAQIPQFGLSYAGGRTGVAAGSKLGSAFGPRGRAIGALLGGVAGTVGASYPGQLAGNIETQAEEQISKDKPIDINLQAAATAAAPQAALDAVANLPFFGRGIFGKMLGIPEAALIKGSAESVERLAKESLAATITKGTTIGFAAEFPTEIIQQAIQRYQAGKPLTSPEAYKEYGEIAYQTALLSPLGTAGRALDKRGAKADVQQKAYAEQQIADAEAQKAAQEVAPVQPQDIAGRYQAAEKRKAELKAQIRKVEEGSVTETADRLYNKELEEQIKAMAPELEQLATEYNQFQKTAPTPEAAAEPEITAPEEIKPTRALTVGDSLDNPLGRFTKEELTSRSPKIAAYVDAQRKKMGKPSLNDYSIEDIRDAMPGQLPEAEKADLNSLIAAKTGHTGEVIYKPEDVVNIAKQKNINTDTVGFKYFLQRATGDNDLSNMSQPQLHSAFKSLSELPKYEETQNLPEKSSATHYSPEQYQKAVDRIKSLTTDGILPSAKAQEVAKQASGLKRDSDVQYMLQSAYRNGDLDLDSQGNFIRVNPVPQSEFRVEEGFEPAEPTGFNVMRGDKVLFSTQNEAEAKAKAKTLGDSAAPTIKQVEKSIANEQKALDASQRSLDAMEANGLFGTPEYNKASAKHTALVEESAKKVGELSKTKEYLQQEVTVKTGKKAANVKAFTTKEKGVSEKSFATRDEALQHAIENHTVARLNEIAAETKSPGLKARISKELERRKNPKPFLAAEKPVQEPVQQTAKKPAEEPLVTAQKESIKSQLLPMLKRFGLGDVALQIQEAMKAEGSYAGSLIKVALDANNPIRVLRHESLHGLKDLGFFTKGQWGVLENQADKVWIDKYLKERNIDGRPLEAGQQSRYDAYYRLYKGNMQAVREEAIADAFGDFDVNGAPKGLFATLLNNMRQFFEALRNSFNGAGYMTSDDVFGKIERGELKATKKAGTTEKPSLIRRAVEDEKEISTQNPQAKGRLYDPLTDMLSIDEAAVRESMQQNPELERNIINAIKSYGFIPINTKDEDVIKVFKDNIVSNLLHLHDRVPKDVRERSKLWYDGANKIASELADKYDMNEQQVAGILAAMSPQKDWFQNVSMAERAIDILTNYGDATWTPDMLKYAESYISEAEDRADRDGRQIFFDKRIKKMSDDQVKLKDMNIKDAAAFVRAYDEAFNDRKYNIVTPEGGFGGTVMNKNPDPDTGLFKPATMMWSTYSPIEKTVSIFRDPSRKNISEKLGEEHKIRSFYNNIVAPNSPIGHVTIDTHAVAAALYESLAGTDPEVTHNFGGVGKNTKLGVGGTYGLIAEAYREAAAKVGLKPREMQSVTWEAVRGMFPENIKSQIKQKVRDQWTMYRTGEQTFEKTRSNIEEIGDRADSPDWVKSDEGTFVEDGGSSFDVSFKPEGGVRLRKANEIKEKATVNLSAVTGTIPGLQELHTRALNGDVNAYEVLQKVATSTLKFLLSGTKAKISFQQIKGVYEEGREPAIMAQINFRESELDKVLGALSRFGLNFNQEAIHVRTKTKYKAGHNFDDGSYATPVYTIPLKEELTEQDIVDIVNKAGLKGFSVSKTELIAYHVQGELNDISEYDDFLDKVRGVHATYGATDKRLQQGVQRLAVYGDGYGARTRYKDIASDFYPKQVADRETPRIIAEYLNEHPIKPFEQKPLTKSQKEEQTVLKDVFEALPVNDLKKPIVRKAYAALAAEVKRQYQALPIKVELTNPQYDKNGNYLDIYENSAEVRKDVSLNNRFRVLKTNAETFGPEGADFSSHPLLESSGLRDVNGRPMLYNDLLRAVHDYFAHNLSDTEFGPKGEFAAWKNHMATTKNPLARWALTQETRAQNAWQNFRPEVENLSLKDRGFAQQKAALPPATFALTGDLNVDAPMVRFIESLNDSQKLGSLSPKSKLVNKIPTLPKGEKASLRTAPDTPEFKRFFGDSKVVDADGNPMVVYHATPKNFTFFDPRKLTKNTKHPTARLGFFTATDPSSTDEFIRIPYGIGKGMYEEGANVMPVYASIKNPAVINSGEFVMQSMALQNMKKKDADRFIDDYIQSLRDEGHDGILIKGNKSGRGLAGGNEFTSDNWVALDNTQFKSAIGNTGAYGQRVPTLEEAKTLGITQKKAAELQEKGDVRFSLRTAPDTPEFKRFFGDSRVVNADGTPKVLYHGSARDIGSFKRKTDRGVPIFLTDDPTFAEKFSKDSMAWMTAHPDQFLTETQIKEGRARAIVAIRKDFKQDTQGKEMIDSLKSGKYGDATAEAQEYLRKAYKDMMPSGPNIVAAYVKAENPFDYQNPSHVKRVLSELSDGEDMRKDVQRGSWETIESESVQDAIKFAGFDSFYVEEGGRKNLAVYDSSQIKSATGNVGAYGQRPVTKEEAARSGMTQEEAQQAQAEGDIRYSLGNAAGAFDQKELKKEGVTGSKSRYKMVDMNIDHFLNLAEYGRVGTKLQGTKDRLAKGEKFTSIPYMYINTDGDSVKVVGHEGRHRALALKDAGYTTMPVQLRSDFYRWSEQADPDNFDYQKTWPKLIQAQDGAISERFSIPFPFTREESPLNYGEIPASRYSLRTNVSEDIKNMPNGAAIFAAINRTTQTRQEVGFIERITEALAPESFSYLRQKGLDRYNRLSDVERLVAQKMGGVERLADSNAHAAALQSDLAAGVAASALGVGDRIGGIPVYKDGYTTVSNEGGTVKGAVEIFAPLARYGDPKMYQAYQFWAASKRGKRLLASGKEELFTPQDFAYAKQLEQQYPEFVSVQKDWIKYNDGLVKYAVDTGVISAQNAAEFVKYSDYLPFYRQIEGERTIGPNIFQSISGVKAPKKITGSEAPLADFLETIVRNTQATIQAGMKNVAAKKAADAGVMIGMVQKLDHVSSSPNTITILEKGQKVSYECADRLWVDAVSSLNLPELPFLSIFAKPADLLRNMVTKDPGFMLANLMRDSVSAYVTSGAKIAPLVSTMKEFGSVLMNSSPEYQKLLSAGVLGGYEFSRDIEASTSEFAKDIRKKTGTKTAFETATSPFTFFWNGLEKGTTASDAATRIAIYKATLKETGNEAEALHRSLEVMNFNRKGSSAVVRIAAAVIPFLNARVQGLDVFFRSGIRPFFNKDATAMEKQVQKAMFVRGATIMAMSAMYAAAIAGNPDYENQEEEVKDNNWIIPLGEGRAPLKIPTPFEVGTLFKTIPERIYRSFYGMDTNKDSAEAAKRALSNTFGISPMPQIISPLIEAKTNYSMFTHREIVSGNMKDVAPEYQVGANTSKVAQEIGMATGMSPIKLEYVYKGYTGTMGMYALDVLDASITSLMPNSGVQRASKRFEQMPVIKRFFADPEARGKITAYYDLKNSVDSVVRTINFLEKSNDPSIADYAQKNAMLYAAKDFINDLNKQMQDLQDQANMIRSADIPADQKRDILLEITKAQNLLVNDIRAIRKVIQP